MKYYVFPTASIRDSSKDKVAVQLYKVDDQNHQIDLGSNYEYDCHLRQMIFEYDTDEDLEAMSAAIHAAKNREAAVTLDIDFHNHADNSYYKNIYCNIFRACSINRAAKMKQNLTNSEHRIEQCLRWLETKTDFFEAPASAIYHESYDFGLVEHTLKVVAKIRELHTLPSFNHVDIYSAIFCALVHDWCKIGLYESYMRNVKNDQTGQWEKHKSFKRKERRNFSLGHGTSSMFLANKWFSLTYQEAEAIRWHMGVWNVCDVEMDELEQANETNPYVHLLQFADQLAITDYAFNRS